MIQFGVTMKKTSIRELKHSTSRVLALVTQGQNVEVTRHNRVVAVLTPPAKANKIVRPDFEARMTELWGDKRLKTSWHDLITEDRGSR